MGFMDTVKGWFTKSSPQIAEYKEKGDDLVDQHRDKIPDPAEKVIDQASDAADKYLPGDGKPNV